MLRELFEHFVGDRIGESFAEIRGCVDDSTIVEDEVQVGGLVGVVSIRA